jgi:hypothetical protein
MIGARNVGADKAKQEGVKRVREWLVGLLPADEKEELDGGTAADGEETSVIVNQLACKEPGCPDVELVITLLRAKPRPKLMFKIYKPAADLTSEEVESGLQKAMADEQKELAAAAAASKGAHEHEHEEGKEEHNHAHGEDCGCDHDHGHDAEHDSHQHGHT